LLPSFLYPPSPQEPVHADVRLRVEFGTPGADDVLHGVMDLDVEVLQPGVSSLKLHQFQLQIASCSVFSGGRTCKCDSWTPDAENQWVLFRFPAALDVGRATVHVTWTANVSRLPDPRPGEKFWKGVYVQHYGLGSYHCMTQFEPCNARSVYPCFDQPCTKQTFRLTLSNVPTALTVLSNTEIESETADADNTKTVTFRPTAPTPAYLTAFVIGVFERLERSIVLPNYEEAQGGQTVPLDVRVFVPRELAAQGFEGGYGLELVCKAVSFFTHEFRVNYPYSKLDNVSSPLHPLLGMENWGLITYSAGFLDIRPGAVSLDRRKRIARLVAHEVLHQWFGNSTTVGWWSALYLKEGFARLLEYVFVDHTFPEWHYFDHFQSDIYGAVLHKDEELHDTHPVQHRIDVPAQIFSNVGIITYAKGACVLRQLWSYLGAETFFASLQLYLRRHRNDCVMPAQLWQAMTDASNGSVDVAALMDCWVTKSGHPYIRGRCVMLCARLLNNLSSLD
jgi:aminopeptidase 2